ncbi:hypothetical protein HYT00_02595 [Candidatus Giovannonibacteria bacterium]|nr:hypothetical protein [Candidatus Giovannonibacteria bacterium]
MSSILINYYTLSLSIGSFIALISGLIVLIKDRKRLVSISWFLLNFCTVVWSFGYFIMISSRNYSIALIANLILHQGAIFIPFFYFFFILALTNSFKEHKLVLWLMGSLAFVFSLINPTSLFTTGVIPKYIFNFVPNAGPLYFYFTLYFFIPIIYALFILFQAYLKSSSDEAQRFKFVFLASITGFMGGASVFFLTFNIIIPPYPIILVPVYQVIIAYAISKHSLFDIRVVATELLIFIIWMFLSIRIFLADSLRDRLIDGGLLILVILFGILLIRSVLREVRQREEIQKLAEDLRKANLELKKLDQLKSEFVSLASHQLRTPLTVIKGYISMIQEGSYGVVPESLKDALRKVYFSNERLINLVGDFLNLSRIESGKLQYMFQPISIEEITGSVYEEFKEVAKEKKLELIYEHPEEPLPQAMIDKDKFRQVIMNLLDNAVKYTKQGFIKLKVGEDGSRPGWPSLLINISDSGIGMSQDDLEMIFKRFSRGEQGFKANTGGLGLGLYLAKRIVNDHGGEIWATSDGVGKGSTFWVRVPARAEQVKKEREFKEFVAKI